MKRKRIILLAVLIAAMLLAGVLVYFASPAASVGIIGGADGPTAIYVTRPGK